VQYDGNLRLVHSSNLGQGTGHQQRFQGNATPADVMVRPSTGHDCGLETLMADHQLLELPDIMQLDGGHVSEQNTAGFHPAPFETRSHKHTTTPHCS